MFSPFSWLQLSVISIFKSLSVSPTLPTFAKCYTDKSISQWLCLHPVFLLLIQSKVLGQDKWLLVREGVLLRHDRYYRPPSWGWCEVTDIGSEVTLLYSIRLILAVWWNQIWISGPMFCHLLENGSSSWPQQAWRVLCLANKSKDCQNYHRLHFLHL